MTVARDGVSERVGASACGSVAEVGAVVGQVYAFAIGKLGEAWSSLPGNEGLPEHVKQLIDSPVFQRSNLDGLADLEAGRSYSWQEFLERRKEARGD